MKTLLVLLAVSLLGCEVCPEYVLEVIPTPSRGLYEVRVFGSAVSGFGCQVYLDGEVQGSVNYVVATPGQVVQAVCGNCPTVAVIVP